MPITDLGARPIPGDTLWGGQVPTLAVPPVYQAPDTTAQEFLYTAYGVLPSAAAAYVDLTDVSTLAPFAQRMDPNQMGRLASLSIVCPDMVTDVAPYLIIRVSINKQPVNGWGTIALPPIAGVTRVAFDCALLIPANAQLGLSVLNQDPAQQHYVQVQLYGWTWPA